MENLKNILEALIFVSDKPLELRRIKEVLPEAEAADILRAIDEIRTDCENRGGGFALKEIAGGYQFRTRSTYQEYVRRLVRPKPIRLSKATLETLAIIAYKQPITRAEVDHIRGVDSSNILRLLLERKLIRVLGRREVPGRPLIYVTTRFFLELFELKDLKELPTPREIEEMGTDEEPDYEAGPPPNPQAGHGEDSDEPLGDEGFNADIADDLKPSPSPSEAEDREASPDMAPDTESAIEPESPEVPENPETPETPETPEHNDNLPGEPEDAEPFENEDPDPA